MPTYYPVAYRSYGEWRLTRPFYTNKEAEKHIKLNLSNNEIKNERTGEILAKNTNDHIKDVHIIPVELPE